MVQLAEGLSFAGRFRLVRELGRGGMGAVWLAEHTTLDTLCALKFIDREGQNSPEARQRFEREAKAAAHLRSPHVVQILDHGVWENIPYIAMEYLEGEDLGHRLDRVKRLSASDTFRICTQVSRALTKAHAAAIVHRDLKPENIFLARDDDGEIAKVLDFGIAKRLRTNLAEAGTKTGSLLGTPFYMSPEQARGTRGVDYRSDLFSLAVIIYQCMTGELPFFSEGLGDVLAQIMYEPMPVPSERAPGMPPGFDAWWARASSRDPDGRFQSAKELTEGLATVLRISDPLEIPTLMLSTKADSRSRDEKSERFFGPRAMPTEAARRTLAEGTTAEPLSRTFDPAPTSRRRTALVVAGLAVATLVAGVVGVVVLRSVGSSSTAMANASAATTSPVVAAKAPPPSPGPDVVPDLASATPSAATPGAATPGAATPGAVTTPAGHPAAGAAPLVPRRPKAAPKPPLLQPASQPAASPRHDYGI